MNSWRKGRHQIMIMLCVGVYMCMCVSPGVWVCVCEWVCVWVCGVCVCVYN